MSYTDNYIVPVYDKEGSKIVHIYDYSNVPDNKCRYHGEQIAFGGHINLSGIQVWTMPNYIIDKLNDKSTCKECLEITKRLPSQIKYPKENKWPKLLCMLKLKKI